MNATDRLRAEHEGIMTMLDILERVCDQMASRKPANLDHLGRIIEFLSVFADKCHHGKEENILFPALEKVGIAKEGGPIGVMLTEHDRGRELIRLMRKAVEELKGGRDTNEDFVKAARAYIDLLRNHIVKENNVLFVMAEKNLAKEEQAHLFEAFETMEREEIGEGTHEAFHLLLDELKGLYL